jgi:hypothetical protein
MDNNKRQSIIDYFNTLQVEYLISEIRKKIYPTSSDKRHYEKVMGLKKDKIEDIAAKNSLKSIFNSADKKAEFISSMYPVKGLPNFGKHLKDQDVTNYYSKNALVKVYSDAEADADAFYLARIISFDNIEKVVEIRCENEDSENVRKIFSGLITRIL